MFLPHEVVRALGGSLLMIRTARGRRSWSSFWQAIDRPSWLGHFIVQVAARPEALAEIIEIARGPIDRAAAEAVGAAQSAARASQALLAETMEHTDMLPYLLSATTNLLVTSSEDSRHLDGVCDSIREIVGADEFVTLLRQSSWVDFERPLVTYSRATLAIPAFDGRSSVRSTATREIYVVDSWLVVANRAFETHYPMRLVEHLEL